MLFRLGPLGFLSTYDSDVGGNNGLRDQVMAMEWIKANIQKFGGDSSSVTLFGGGSVGLHILSPMSKGLFNRFAQRPFN